MIDFYLTLGMIGSISGCIFVACNRAYLANITWVMFNPLMIIHNLNVKEYEQAGLWALYVMIAAVGVIKHTFFKRR